MFLDLSKSFDTLDHDVLIRKLEKYGIRGNAKQWFKDYLTNRKMRTKCVVASTGKMEYSEYQNITYVSRCIVKPRTPGWPFCTCLGYQVPPDLATVLSSLYSARFSLARPPTSVRMFGTTSATP